MLASRCFSSGATTIFDGSPTEFIALFASCGSIFLLLKNIRSDQPCQVFKGPLRRLDGIAAVAAEFDIDQTGIVNFF